MQNRQIYSDGRNENVTLSSAGAKCSPVKTERFEDCDQLAQLVPAASNRYVQVGRGKSGGVVRQVDLGCVVVHHNQIANQILCHAVGNGQTQYSIIPLSWRGVFRLNGKIIPSPCVLNWGARDSHYVRIGSDVDSCALMHRQAAFLNAAAAWSGVEPSVWARARGWFLPAFEASVHLPAMLARILMAMESQPEFFASPERRAQLGEELTIALLECADETSSENARHSRSLTSHSRIVRQCEDYVRSGSAARITKLDLCRVTGASARSVQNAFRAIHDLTPVEYLKLSRLQNARRRLRDADPACSTVKECALDAGILDMGRFAVEYRRHFGEKPHETLLRI